MARKRRRWGTVGAVTAAAVLVSVVLIGLVGGLSGGGASGGASAQGQAAVPSGPTTVPSGPTTVATAPTTVASGPTTTVTAGDVAAARACQAFTVYLDDAEAGHVPAAAGRALAEDAAVLLRGAEQDQAAGRALPPWALLGADLLASADDVVAHKAASLKTDGAAAGAQCRSVPAAAARAGGFKRSG